MEQKLFPGGTTTEWRKEEKRLAKERKAKEKAEKAKKAAERAAFFKAIGPLARLMILRRTVGLFLVGAAASAGICTFGWHNAYSFANPDAYNATRTNIYDAVKTNIYNAVNWRMTHHEILYFDFIALCGICVTALFAKARYMHNLDVASRTAELCHNLSASSTGDSIMMARLYHLKKPGKIYDYDDYCSKIYNPNNKLHPVCRAVIKNIASQDYALFEAIMNGHIEPTRDFLITVIRGHMKSHPEDFDRVLAAYEPESIPKLLKLRYGRHAR